MNRTYRKGAVGALLDIYEQAIEELQQTIADITDEELVVIADKNTRDPNCQSVQTVLSHVVRSAYGDAVYIRQYSGEEVNFPDSQLRLTIKEYHTDLNTFFDFLKETFSTIRDNQLEESDPGKKIMTSWGQVYDIEQLVEHAIVHILRHKRQIEKFKLIVRGHK